MKRWHIVALADASLSTALLTPLVLGRFNLITEKSLGVLYHLYASAAGMQYLLLGRNYIQVSMFEQVAFFWAFFMVMLAIPITICFLLIVKVRSRAT